MSLFLLSLSLYGSEWVGPASHRGLEMLVGPQADSLSQCHETYAPSVFYGATLEFRAKRGRVRRVRVRQANQDLPELERCLRQAAGRWRVSETVDASLSWPVVLLPADATLAGEQPSLTLGQEGVFAAALQGALQEQAAGLGDGVLVLQVDIADSKLQAKPLRDTSADQSLSTALIAPLAWTAAPDDLALNGLRVVVTGTEMPTGRAPRDREIQSCMTQEKSILNLVLLRGRVLASWGDDCLADKALAWQMDPALTGTLRWALATPPTPNTAATDLPVWKAGETGDLTAQLSQQMAYYRTRGLSCFEQPGSVVIAVDVVRGESQNPRIVDGQVPPQAQSCLLTQALAWTWPLDVQGERRIKVNGP